MSKSFSIRTAGSKTYFTFASRPPASVRDELKSNGGCKWDPFRKHWACSTAQSANAIRRLLTQEGWVEAAHVQPQRVPLTVKVTPQGNELELHFNRKVDADTADAIQDLAKRDATNPLKWVAIADNGTALKAALHAAGLDLPDWPADATTLTATLTTPVNMVCLAFDAPVTPDVLRTIQDALSSVGIQTRMR